MGFVIRVTFNDLTARTVDFRAWLEGPVFEALNDPAYFREFFVDGGTVVWPNGADIAPETLYEAATSKQRRMAKARVKPSKVRVRKRQSRH